MNEQDTIKKLREAMKDNPSWDELKSQGSAHYKTGGVEPIDLFLAGGMFRDKALADIIKYAFRNRQETGKPLSVSDLNKIIDYTQKLKATIEG
jgi:hypothetical protein